MPKLHLDILKGVSEEMQFEWDIIAPFEVFVVVPEV